MSCFVLIDDNIKYKGYSLYYKKPIDESIYKASEFNGKYKYFYKDLNNKTTTLKPLGKFKIMSKRSSNCRWNDYDYDVYEFTNDYIDVSDKDNIYCQGISESEENMTLVKDMDYLGFPIYHINN
jgi:hypothetical protein